MANVARNDDMTTDHMEVLTDYHWELDTFFRLKDDNIIDILH